MATTKKWTTKKKAASAPSKEPKAKTKTKAETSPKPAPKPATEVVDAPVEKEQLPKAVRVDQDPLKRVEVEALVTGRRNIGGQCYLLSEGKPVSILRVHLELLEGAGAVKRKA